MLGADAILERGDGPGAIAYLQQRVGLCYYLASCPLLNVLLKLGGLYLDESQMKSAQIMFTNVVAADPVDRVDEQGAEQAIRAETNVRGRRVAGLGSHGLLRRTGGDLEFVVATRFGLRRAETFDELLATMDTIGPPTDFPLADWPGVTVSVIA